MTRKGACAQPSRPARRSPWWSIGWFEDALRGKLRKESGWSEQNDVGQAALRFYSDLVDPLHVPRDELTLTFSQGARFSVSRDVIRRLPKEHYERLLANVTVAPTVRAAAAAPPESKTRRGIDACGCDSLGGGSVLFGTGVASAVPRLLHPCFTSEISPLGVDVARALPRRPSDVPRPAHVPPAYAPGLCVGCPPQLPEAREEDLRGIADVWSQCEKHFGQCRTSIVPGSPERYSTRGGSKKSSD